MGTGTDRLERLIADEVGECCAGYVESRLIKLRGIEREAAVPTETADVTVLGALTSERRYRTVRLLQAAEDELRVERRKEGKWYHYRTTDRADRILPALDDTKGRT